MSEDDRAAKAARAKALLKKRQQQKATNTTNPGVATPPRTFSPAPQEPPTEGDSRVLFPITKDTPDTSWLASIPQATSPPPLQHDNITARSPSSLATTHAQRVQEVPSTVTTLQKRIEFLSKQNETLTLEASRAAQQADILLEDERRRVEELKANYDKLRQEMEIALQNERRTVSLLVSEKAHLTSELAKLEDVESKSQALEDLLESERTKSASLDERVTQFQLEIHELSLQAEQSKLKEKGLLDHNKEQERQLQFAAADATDLRKTAGDLQRRLRELEGQIQADDRVERLEVSLKHTQDRAVELEFQLTKVKQAHASLRMERDGLESKLQESLTKESKWTSTVSSLHSQLTSTRDKLSDVEAEYNRLSEEKLKFQQQLQASEITAKDLQAKLAEATSVMTAMTRQLQHTQNELKNALRRAEDAESLQQSLQAEGTTLMRSLDEMRPKIVELTSTKVDLSEKLGSLEYSLRSRDSTITQLESDLDQLRDKLEQSEMIWKTKLAQQEKQQANAAMGTADIQNAYSELQEELDVALASLRKVELQRANHHQEASRNCQEIERLSQLTKIQVDELDTLREELEAVRKLHDEEQEFIERAQNEIEVLRSELSVREEEITHLHEATTVPNSPVPRPLDEELLSSFRQQHSFEYSAATSQIRALESIIFDKDSTIHALQKRVNGLQEHSKSNSVQPPSLNSNHYDTSRSSFHAHRPTLPSPLARTVFDQAMTPETFHKRKVSLTMLKARMQSEARTNMAPPVQSDGQTSRPSSVASNQLHNHRPQFLDESHVFWCHSCSDDLVIL